MGKNIIFSLMLLSLLLTGCKSPIPEDINSYVVKISEIGITDISRETLVFFADTSYKDKNTNFVDFFNSVYFLTDKESLYKVIEFITEYSRDKKSSQKIFSEYGSSNISVYKKGLLIVSYNLKGATNSRSFIQQMITMFENKQPNKKLIEELKHLLGEI
jgi:hypothetical protein